MADSGQWDRLEQRLTTGKWPGTDSTMETSPAAQRYFLTETRDRESVEREVTLEEYCRAERAAGFRPKNLRSTDPGFMTTPATSSFSGNGISGRSRRHPVTELKGGM